MKISIILSTICILALSNAFLMSSRNNKRALQPSTTTSSALHLRVFPKKSPTNKQQSAQEFEDYVIKSMNATDNKNEVIENIAVKFLNFLLGDWDAHVNVAIETTNNDVMTKLDNVKANDNVQDKKLEGNKDKAMANVKESYGMKIESTYNTSSFPPRDQYDCYVGPTLCIQALGLSSYDLLDKKYNFTLDTMTVFGVSVNLTSVLEDAAAAKKNHDGDSSSKRSMWRRVFGRNR